MCTPSLCPPVWVESWGSERARWGGAARDERARGSYPCVSGGFPGRTLHSVMSVAISKALRLITLHNVHLKQYLHLTVRFNIWVTPSSQLQNTPQRGISGQPIIQHVTKVVGSILENRTIIKWFFFSYLMGEMLSEKQKHSVVIIHYSAQQATNLPNCGHHLCLRAFRARRIQFRSFWFGGVQSTLGILAMY